MLDSIDKEIEFFCEALARTENDLKAGGSEVRYLLERIAALRQSYEEGKKTIDVLRKQSLNEIQEKLE